MFNQTPEVYQEKRLVRSNNTKKT